uniref:Tag-280 protein n=1 Tax=Pristionchus pacificus TaxID=54126 RepID=A0A2A6B857_PRIPA|eukprot:PDM62056.1 tag-280 protein [Pristionchus pacificus]
MNGLLMGQNNAKLDFAAIERQQQAQFESKLAAVDLAFARKQALDTTRRGEMYAWECVSVGTCCAALAYGALFMNRKYYIPLMAPLICYVGFRYENEHGKQLETVMNNAERLLKESPELFARPGGPITVSELERLRGQISSLMGQSNVKLDASAIEKQRQDQLEYELAKTDLTFVRNHALDIADRRERFAWESLATGTLLAALCVWGSFMKRKDFIIPCVPLVLGAGYRYENSYGEQLETLRDNAERLLQESPQLLTRPGGPITMAEIDRLRGQISLMGQSNVKLDASSIERQQLAQFESQLAAADLAFARKQAIELARHRRLLRWEVAGACSLVAVCFGAGVMMRRRDIFLIPFVPPLIIAGYRFDAVYGDALEGVRNNAERLLKESPELFVSPGGPITVSDIDRLRAQMYGST